MPRPFLTVLTTPVPGDARRAYQALRARARPVFKPGATPPPDAPYPGHHALVRSVVEGLRAIGADFNFNPRRRSEVARIVYAPANEALRQAAEMKRTGSIDYLVAGPVNALFADESDGILRTPEIDRLIVAHNWVIELLRDQPAIAAKCRACPSGVDATYWAPSADAAGRHAALVYWKSGDEAFCEEVERIVRACGLAPRRVRAQPGEHALFTPAEYRRLLDQAAIGVFLSAFESQGLALAEAWSMNVPTVVWNPRGPAAWQGHVFQAGSSAPYLTPATGRDWRGLDELERALRGALADRAAFEPRQWVLENMTDAICSAALLGIIREGAAGR